MGDPATECELLTLVRPGDPPLPIRLRVEGPPGYRRGEGLPAVILLHGFKGFMHWGFFPELSRRIAAAGMVAVSFNTSGSGIGEDLETFTEEQAFASDTYSRELEDLDLVRAHVREALAGVDRERLGILGHSRGGGVVLLHAARHGDYRAVATWAAIDTVDSFDEATKARWREEGCLYIHNARTGQDHRIDLDALLDAERNREALDILAACARLTTPTLVVHGSQDPAVEYAAAGRLLAALPEGVGRLLCVEGAGHTFGATHPLREVTEDLERVFSATLAHLGEHLA